MESVFAATNRVDVNFDQNWKFNRGDVTGAEAPGFIDAAWPTVCLPHSVRLEPKYCSGSGTIYQGIAWYRKSFTLDSKYSGCRIFIEFEAVMHQADLWINGTQLTTHYGGYLPFTVDITPYAKFDGTDNVIAVKANNSDNVDIPPGRSDATLDFHYFGGIYRDVWMHITDKLHITDPVYANKTADGGIFVTYPAASTSSATVQVKTNVKNEYATAKSCQVRSIIVDSSNVIIATDLSQLKNIATNGDSTFTQSITVASPKLWSPDRPYLYSLRTYVNDGTGDVDSCTTRIGIRRIVFTAANGFSINGQRVILTGAGRHQDYCYVGNAIVNSEHCRDAIRLRESGFNFCRTAHYPQDPAFFDACDKFGICVIVCEAGWQYFGGTTFQQRTYQDIKDMVRRDRNHPSVVLWESCLNETGYSQAWAQTAHNTTHAEYPGDQCYTVADWGAYGSSVYDCTYKECASSTKPVLTREWGDQWYMNPYTDIGPRTLRAAGEVSMDTATVIRAKCLNGTHIYADDDWCGLYAYKRMAGFSLWGFADVNRGDAAFIGGWGIFDVDRYPKYEYWFFRSQMDPALRIQGCSMGPMVKITNYWMSTSPKNTHVYSNCQQIKLYLNNTLVATQNPDAGFTNLPRSSIYTFSNVTWSAGTLRADGLIGGTVVASDTVRTPGAKTQIKLVVDDHGIPTIADGSDFVMVYVKVCDANGTVVPTDTSRISLTISGPGTIIGDGDSHVGVNPVKAEAGVAPILVRAGLTAGDIVVTGSQTNLTSGSVTIHTGAFVGTKNHLDGAMAAHAPIVRTFKTTGDRFVMPQEFTGKTVTVAVYDLCGRLLYSATIKPNGMIDLSKSRINPNTVHLVKLALARGKRESN